MSNVTSLASRVAETALRIQRRSRQEKSVHGLTGARLAALARLDSGGRLSLTGLAAAENVAPATMARIVDALEKGKLVVRQHSPEDGRIVWVVPTALGRSFVHGSHKRRLRWLESFLANLSEADRAILERAVAILAKVTAR